MNVFVTGASRGIGLEFVRQYLERGECVFAGCRNPLHSMGLRKLKEAHPHDLTVLPLDVADADSIHRCHQLVGERTKSLDLLINAAGIYCPQSDVPLARENAGLLEAGENPRVISIGSALNGDVRSVADDFKSRGITVIVLQLGTVLDLERFVREMIRTIEGSALKKQA